MSNIYESKDKQIVPFLLVQSQLQFLGTRQENNIIFFQFSPFELCQKLVNEFMVRKAPLVQPKDLLDAVESYRDIVFEMKDKRKNYGGLQ